MRSHFILKKCVRGAIIYTVIKGGSGLKMAAAEVLKFQLTRIYAATNAVFYGAAIILFFTFIVFRRI